MIPGMGGENVRAGGGQAHARRRLATVRSVGEGSRRRSLAVVLAAVVAALLLPAVSLGQTAPTITESFSPTQIAVGTTSTVTFTVTNPDASVPDTTVAFTDSLPSGLAVASTPNISDSCSPVSTTTATGGSSTISSSDPTIPAGASCTIAVDVTGVTAGSWDNPVTVNSDQGSGATGDVFLNVDGPPTVAAAFSPSTIPSGGTTTLTFTLTNPTANPDPAGGVAVNDTLPTGLTVATPNGLTNTCGGTATAGSGTGSITLTGATIALNSNCALSVSVTSTTPGAYTDTTGTASSTDGGTGTTASAHLNVDSPPTLAAAFNPSTFPSGGTSTLTFTLTNPNTADQLTGVGFTDALAPSGLGVAHTPDATDTCGGTFTPAAGDSNLTVSGETLAANSSCTISVDVTGTQSGTQHNTTSTVSSEQGGTGTAATAQFDIVPGAPPTLSAAFSPGDIRPGGTSQLTFTIANPAANPTNATNVGFDDMLPSGLTVQSGSSSACGGGTLTATSPSSLSFAGATLTPGQQCQIPVTVTAATDGVFTNTTGQPSSTEGGPGAPASATLTAAAPPAISAGFGTALLGLDGTTPLTLTITNPNHNVTLTGIAFSDTLPSGLVIVGPFAAGNTCGGLVAATGGSSQVALSGGQLGPGGTCTVSETIAATATGLQSDFTGAISSNEGGAGNAGSAAVTVVGAPKVSISSPVGGRGYAFGQEVTASYSCTDDPNGPGVSMCVGDVANGAPINTSKAGTQTFTVTAVSKDGGAASDIVFYTVAPNNRVALGKRHVQSDGALVLTLTVPGPGKLSVTETISRGHIVFAHRHIVATRAGKLRLTIRPTARGRLALQRTPNAHVSVVVGYTPQGGTERTVRFRFVA